MEPDPFDQMLSFLNVTDTLSPTSTAETAQDNFVVKELPHGVHLRRNGSHSHDTTIRNSARQLDVEDDGDTSSSQAYKTSFVSSETLNISTVQPMDCIT